MTPPHSREATSNESRNRLAFDFGAREAVERAIALWPDDLPTQRADAVLAALHPIIAAEAVLALRRDGWTCEYHEPVSKAGECRQCDKSHRNTAKRIASRICGGEA